jgi:tetratricopeptide (TPR) repeat protein
MAIALAPRVLQLTRGEPLFARFVCEDIATAGEQTLTRLEADPPRGVKEYFRQQFNQLDARASGDTAWEVLGLLLVAQGPMTIQELAAVLGLPIRHVRKAIEPIQRFLLGRERLELMHLELRAVVADQFTPSERQAYRQKLRAWCASFAEADWQDDTPDYVLACYAAHLHEASDRKGLYGLLNRRWMQLKAIRTHSHRAFAQDVLLAIEAASSEQPSNLVELIRGSHIYATLTSLAANVPPEVLGVLAQLDQRAKAEGYADLISDPQKRSSAYCQIASALLPQGKLSEAKHIIDKALTMVRALNDSQPRAEALGGIASVLAEAGCTDQAVVVADQALTAAQEIWNIRTRAEALANVARVLVKAGCTDQAVVVADQALTAAQEIKDDQDKAKVLTSFVRVLAEAGCVDQALTAAQAIENDQDKARTFASVARVLAETGQINSTSAFAEQALELARLAGRNSFFQVLQEEVQILSLLNDSQALSAIGQALIEVERWWLPDGSIAK